MGAAPGVVAIAEGRPNRAVTLNLLDDLPDIPRRISVSLRTQPPSPGRRARPAAEHWLATGTNLPRAFFMRGGHEELLLTPAGRTRTNSARNGTNSVPIAHEVGTNRARSGYQSRTKWVPIAHEVGTNRARSGYQSRTKWVPIAHELRFFVHKKTKTPNFRRKVEKWVGRRGFSSPGPFLWEGSRWRFGRRRSGFAR